MLTFTISKDQEILYSRMLSLGGTILIGRKGKGADIEIDSPFVSGKHLSLSAGTDGKVWVTDLGSANGTFIGNFTNRLTPEKPVEVRSGELILITANASIVLNIQSENSLPAGKASAPPPIVIKQREPESQENGVMSLKKYLETHAVITFGRSQDNVIPLTHPTVSRYHAKIQKQGEQYSLTDLDSRNGCYVNGQQINGTVPLGLDDVVSIGPYEFQLGTPKEDILASRIMTKAAILAQDLVTTVRGGKEILNLRGITVPIPEGEMIALMGPSGCGKSTLMNAMNGNFPSDPDKGTVKILGFELNQHNFNYLKQFIGFVPQDDIVHRDLTVTQSLWYAAKIKLPDATDEDRQERIDEVLESLRITDKHVEGITSKYVRELSGGQRKRVSIAIELLSKPSVLFLDEPTSPLDPQTIDEFLICLKSLTKGSNGEIGTTIVMVTHKPDDLFHMDKIIFMATGGYLTYYGDVKSFREYFGVEEVKHIYGKIDSSAKGKQLTEKWKQSKEKKALESRFLIQNSPTKQITHKAKKENLFRQTFWLSRRYLTVKTNDRANTMLMLAQAPIIAGLMCLIFDSLNIGVLFMMAVSAIWFGTNNAGREIVGEMPIYLRERMFNVRIIPYVISKVLILSLFSIIQVLIFVSVITLRFDLPDWVNNIGVMFMLSFAATMMGLLVSALVKTNEQVMTLIPIILIPQILLSGVLDKVEGPTEVMSRITISRWGTESFAHLAGEIPTPEDTACRVKEHYFYQGFYEGQPEVVRNQSPVPDTLSLDDHPIIEELQINSDLKTGKWTEGVTYVSIMAALFLILTIFTLRTKDPFRKLKK
ncbi:MAG: FHA domain-containing protein [Bacteroidia bacterium]|nr:FHA domain-containing protein [Bacteroidia bacterium]